MEIKEQVCSLELARKLNELGVYKIELGKDYPTEYVYYNGRLVHKSQIVQILEDTEIYAAPSVAELGEMLPEYALLETRSKKIGWRMFDRSLIGRGTFVGAKTEADVRAKMLIYLLKNKQIKTMEVAP